MKPFGLSVIMTALAAFAFVGDPVSAQPAATQPTAEQDALRQKLERRFEVLALRDGVGLQPKNSRRARLIEVTDAAIAIDGAPVTGGEIREKLGAGDADLVLQLSYLAPAVRQRLFRNGPVPAPSSLPLTPEAVAPPGAPETLTIEPESRPRLRRRGGDGNDRVRFGGSVAVEEGETVNGDVVAIGGSVRVDGTVSGDAVAIGGGLRLGPHAEVEGDVVTLGGALSRDPGARIGGGIVDIPIGNFDFGQLRWRRFPFGRALLPALPFFGAAAGLLALLGTLMRVFVLSILASIVLLVGRDYVERVSARAALEPPKAGAVGVLAQLLFVPLLVATIVVLVITLIGIPLLVLIPFALLALAVVFLVGFTAVAYWVGRLVSAKLAWHDENPYIAAVLGILLLVSPLLVARLLGLANWLMFPITGSLVFLGLLVEYAAWTVGFGAVALQRFARPSAAPPSAPPVTA